MPDISFKTFLPSIVKSLCQIYIIMHIYLHLQNALGQIPKMPQLISHHFWSSGYLVQVPIAQHPSFGNSRDIKGDVDIGVDMASVFEGVTFKDVDVLGVMILHSHKSIAQNR